MGMAEYKNGDFGPFMPISDFQKYMDDLMSQKEAFTDTVRSFHFGTKQELEEVKEKADMQYQIDELKAKVEDLEPLRSVFVHLATPEDIKRYTKEAVKEKIV